MCGRRARVCVMSKSSKSHSLILSPRGRRLLLRVDYQLIPMGERRYDRAGWKLQTQGRYLDTTTRCRFEAKGNFRLNNQRTERVMSASNRELCR
jgi:hypothetical protein